jgi:hypothetical protein
MSSLQLLRGRRTGRLQGLRRVSLKWIGYALVPILCVGCEPVPFTKTKLNPQNLVGSYRLTTATQTTLANAGYSNNGVTRLSLNSDGTFALASMPDRWRLGSSVTQSTTGPLYDSGTGTWHIDSHGDGWAQRWGITLDFSDTRRFASGSVTGRYVHAALMLKNDKPPYILHFIVGDPDGGEGIEMVQTTP